MFIMPAIDIRSKRVVRLLQGDFNKETFYSADVVEVAKKWEEMGAKFLHMVDLDGALAGEPKNLDVIQQVCQSVSIPVQLGGGIRTEKNAELVLSKGVSRVIIGTRAYEDDEFVKRLVKTFGADKIAIGIDAAGDIILSKGWTESTGIDAFTLAKKMESLGIGMIIYTNTLKDGTLESPQLELAKKMLDTVSIKVIISGGVSSLQDIRDLKALGNMNLYGVITGKALYEQRLDLKEAIKIAEEG
ncbi:MAG: 1-(5-phosphoribosyl)-5-[(5-phosphoribosylamino)methylideneamino]imidazole-4-carboxamide isomerase [Candidatus Orphnella occulta]|nr:1-(5-phosphoribosyl)-5-[(5-phosphoribosylamino)methylideneamino]imidazole-4-carboxamide isomerase [Candidatus Orphnella occulta]MDP8297793.1 1-(5-phosphoribosyl)-5-[(5-phosphoribosylamino)methylideneamino]imidazole-4-carboxamide isomerase [Candidatus Orphnella occulta]